MEDDVLGVQNDEGYTEHQVDQETEQGGQVGAVYEGTHQEAGGTSHIIRPKKEKVVFRYPGRPFFFGPTLISFLFFIFGRHFCGGFLQNN